MADRNPYHGGRTAALSGLAHAGFEPKLNQAFLRAEGVRRVAPWLAASLVALRRGAVDAA